LSLQLQFAVGLCSWPLQLPLQLQFAVAFAVAAVFALPSTG
jgi:hypothetical protein